LLDLDAALELAHQAEPTRLGRFEDQRGRRQDLARRDAQAILDQLCTRNASSFPLGEWLNLIARAAHDPDLAPLEPKVREQFDSWLRGQVDADRKAARRSFESGRVVASLTYCDRIPGLLKHLAPEKQGAARGQTQELVSQLVSTHGVVIESPQGQFIFGSQSSYLSSMVPVLVNGLEAKNYLPYRQSSPW